MTGSLGASSFRTAVVLAVAALVLVATPVGAWPAGWSTPIRIASGQPKGNYRASIATTSNGLARVAITQFSAYPGDPGLRFATETSNGFWATETVTSHVDLQPSLALRADGTAKIAFVRDSSSNLGQSKGIYLASQVAGGWAVQRIFKGTVDSPSLLRYSGHDYIAFAGPQSRVYYGTDATGSWRFGHFATRCCAGSLVLRLTANGSPRIAWIAKGNGNSVGYSSRSGGTWSTTWLGSTIGDTLSFQLSDDQPYLTYEGHNGPLLRTLVHGHWTSSTVDVKDAYPFDVAVRPSGAIDVLDMNSDDGTLNLVTVAPTAIASQRLARFVTKDVYWGFWAFMELHAGSLSIAYSTNGPKSDVGVWFTRHP